MADFNCRNRSRIQRNLRKNNGKRVVDTEQIMEGYGNKRQKEIAAIKANIKKK